MRNVLLISVRTDAIKLMTFDLTLVLSAGPPNAGSCCTDPQPTVDFSLVARIRIPVCVFRECVLLARKRSSERMAIALTSNTETERGHVSALDARPLSRMRYYHRIDLQGRKRT